MAPTGGMAQMTPIGSLAAVAGSGGFAVDAVTGERMRLSINDMIDKLDGRMRDISRLTQQARLGSLPEAQAVAALDAQVASGDAQSLDHVLQAFRAALVQAEEAVRLGMANYAEVEQLNADQAHGLGG